MKKVEFGLKNDNVDRVEVKDFITYDTNLPGVENPYGKSYIDNPANIADGGSFSITSIPSPYARMHVTDIAFRELNSGRGGNNLSMDYKRAISHCLDIYELLFRYDEMDLREKGISIELLHLPTSESDKFSVLSPSLKQYVNTLQLFRAAYLRKIEQKSGGAEDGRYHFDFTILYVFKYNNETFAATSPFTGFFSKADCKLCVSVEDDSRPLLSYKNHGFLTDIEEDYQMMDERPSDFKEFMYKLLHYDGDFLGTIFPNLYQTVKNSITKAEMSKYDVKGFETSYPEFNFGKSVLPLLNNTTESVFLRPDSYDKSYFKYLLYLENPISFSVSKSSLFDRNNNPIGIERRVFPDETANTVKWLCVNDILTDSLFVLPYDINENYRAVSYRDEEINCENKDYRRCLIPIKRRALSYFSLEYLEEHLLIRKLSMDHFIVELSLPLSNGGEIKLQRDYFDEESDKYDYPNGILIHKNMMFNFALGIYPFVYSKQFDNIYKVLFYNSFDEESTLKFFYKEKEKDKDGKVQEKVQEYDTNDVLSNLSNEKSNEHFPVNTMYFNVRSESPSWIYFLELSTSMTLKRKTGGVSVITCTSILAPNLKPAPDGAGETVISVDLGTSNTYVAYKHADEDIQEISTVQNGWNELIFLNEECSKRDNPSRLEKNRYDLYLRQSDVDGAISSGECLPAQLCEFIPSLISEDGYSFPIPSVVNNFRDNCRRPNFTDNSKMVPLVYSAIPFAYYEIGKRKNNTKDPGVSEYDCISKGQFKWFYNEQAPGRWQFDKEKQFNFTTFLSELLFIIRSHMICCGYSLDECYLIWTYPLSFHSNLLREYKNIWLEQFNYYFGKLKTENSSEQKKDPAPRIRFTNESRTPIFYCMDNPAAQRHLTVLMDIGGGSTDVILYKDNIDHIVTSFAFAGNALYLCGEFNDKSYLNSEFNIFRKKALEILPVAEANDSDKTVKINGNSTLDSIMNYGFSKMSDDFNRIFDDIEYDFLLKFHTAALIYHTAQLCHIKYPDEIPTDIYLAGNGSNLFRRSQNINEMFSFIFGEVYGHKDNGIQIKIQWKDEPKKATVYGSLKGIESIKFIDGTNPNEIPVDAVSFVMAGDAVTSFENSDAGKNSVAPLAEKIQTGTKANVLQFIDLFYGRFVTNDMNMHPKLTKSAILADLEYAAPSPIAFDYTMAKDSLFFEYISKIMEQISYQLTRR